MPLWHAVSLVSGKEIVVRTLLSLLVLGMLGCGGVSVGTNPEPVDVSGKVSLAGKPVTDMKLNLQPMTAGCHPVVAEVTNGDFQAKAGPGKYTYFLSEGKDKAAFAAVPDKYHSGAEDRTVNVSSGATLNLEFN